MNVMLLAAGEGARLRPYTYLHPKPAIPFLNVPLAGYPLAFLENLKVNHLVVNTFHLPTKIVDLFVHLPLDVRHLHFSHEIECLLGNGGGLGYARDYFKDHGDLVLMNCDEVILPHESGHMVKAMEFHKSSGAICTLITMDHPGVGTQFGGIWLNEKDEVKGFGKLPPTPDCKKAEHFIGVQILSEGIFQYLPNGTAANILYDGVTKALAEGKKVRRYKINCHWYETGNLKDYLQASAECLQLLSPEGTPGVAKEHLKGTIERFNKEVARVERREKLVMLKHSTAKVESLDGLSGFAIIGANAVIGKNCLLKNTVVGNNTTVAPDTHAENELFLEP
jgi:mannose-1-phosphate guanylyltransferase